MKADELLRRIDWHGSLVAHWKFKEGSGNAVADFSGHRVAKH